MRKVHTYNNGIKCYRDTIYSQALSRYENYINLHEPFEDTVFDHIIKNNDIKTFIDVGSAWGYYSIHAKKFNKNTNVIGFDGDRKMIKNACANAKLNDISDIQFRLGRVGIDCRIGVNLEDIINEVQQVDLLKIDIQGAGTKALKSAKSEIVKIKNIILGTHGKEHDKCLELLKDYDFKIKLSLRANEIPIQPDGLLWATF